VCTIGFLSVRRRFGVCYKFNTKNTHTHTHTPTEPTTMIVLMIFEDGILFHTLPLSFFARTIYNNNSHWYTPPLRSYISYTNTRTHLRRILIAHGIYPPPRPPLPRPRCRGCCTIGICVWIETKYMYIRERGKIFLGSFHIRRRRGWRKPKNNSNLLTTFPGMTSENRKLVLSRVCVCVWLNRVVQYFFRRPTGHSQSTDFSSMCYYLLISGHAVHSIQLYAVYQSHHRTKIKVLI